MIKSLIYAVCLSCLVWSVHFDHIESDDTPVFPVILDMVERIIPQDDDDDDDDPDES